MPSSQVPKNLPIYDGTTALTHIKQLTGVSMLKEAEGSFLSRTVSGFCLALGFICGFALVQVGKANLVKMKSSFFHNVLGALFLGTLGMS